MGAGHDLAAFSRTAVTTTEPFVELADFRWPPAEFWIMRFVRNCKSNYFAAQMTTYETA
jgi:hypothetical protein